jgi:parallel beta-helix repeat protein
VGLSSDRNEALAQVARNRRRDKEAAMGTKLGIRSLVVVGLVGAAFVPPSSASAAQAIVVHQGQSIQAAVDEAPPGATILVKPGTYEEGGRPCPTEPAVTCAVVISTDGLKLIAQPKPGRPVVLENTGGLDQGFAIAKTGDPSCLFDQSERIEGALISGFTVTGFEGSGVLLFCADDWRVTGVTAIDNGEYGIFPSHTGAGRVDHSTATGSNDTGIYVGQSRDVRVDHDFARRNVSGFEIENSSGVRVDHVLAEGNTGGILSFVLPFLDVPTNTRNRIDHAVVIMNNKPNTCEPGDDVCNVPAGSGILLVAADSNIVDHNVVSGNDTVGIGVGNLCVLLHLSAAQCQTLGIEPNPDLNRVTFNMVKANGTSPDPIIAPLPGGDLLWDTTGTGNCWKGNQADTTFPSPLPVC